MIESLLNITTFVATNFRLSDAIDIFFASIIFYFFLIFMISKSQKSLFLVISVLGTIFILTQFLHLYLLTSLFQFLLIAMIIIIVITYQDDIRRYIEQLAIQVSLPESPHHQLDKDIRVLTEVVSNLSKKRIGAILVLTGDQSISHIISRGHSLIAQLNNSLVESIFDSRSPGHDGAMIIDRGQINHFGVQLPLSKNNHQIGSLGTRHSAALGLSEKSDAFTIVISEETGGIRVAYKSKLSPPIKADQLLFELEKFFQISEKKDKVSTQLFQNPFYKIEIKILSLLLAIAGWVSITYEPGVLYQTIKMPVSFHNLNDHYAVKNISSNHVNLNISGPPTVIKNMVLQDNTTNLDFKNQEKNSFVFYKSDYGIELPDNIKIHQVIPSKIEINTVKLHFSEHPIHIMKTGRLRYGYKIKNITIKPIKKKIITPSNIELTKLKIWTEEVDMSKIKEGQSTIYRKIILPEHISLQKGEDSQVEISITVKKIR